MTMQECYKAIGGNYEAVLGRLLRNNRKANIPIVAMTANAFSEDMQHSLAAGMNAHISKPVDMKLLKKTIRNIKLGREEAQVIDQ